jgi:hypothetical protein
MIQLKTQLTLEEFLTLPEGDITYELIDGEAVPKFKNDEMASKFFHSSITARYSYYCLYGRKEKGGCN